jgi:glycosyltransferase involved in cell wall biosynthesis
MNLNEASISFLMPVKNGIKYLEKSRQGIEENLGLRDEILIVDDGSDDGTMEYLIDWQREESRLNVIRNNGKGIVSALNLGITECNNEWIARFDVDDEYPGHRIKRQRSEIKKTNVAIFSDYDFIDDNGNGFGSITSAVLPAPTAVSLIRSVRTPHSSVIYNKTAVQECGGYRSYDFPAEDLSLWMRLSRLGNLVSIPEVLLHYKIRSGSVTNLMRQDSIKKRDELIKNIGIPELYIHNCLSELDQILNFYDELNNFSQRKILFFRDLTAPVIFKDYAFNSKIRFFLKLFTQLKSKSAVSEIVNLRNAQRSRQDLRNNLE